MIKLAIDKNPRLLTGKKASLYILSKPRFGY